MKSIDTDRRNFIKKAGGSLIAAAAGSSLALSAMRAHAAQSAVTQTKQTQGATTPQKALQMLRRATPDSYRGRWYNEILCNRSKLPVPASFRLQLWWAV